MIPTAKFEKRLLALSAVHTLSEGAGRVEMQTYPLNCRRIAEKIRKVSPSAKPIEKESDRYGYILWMLEQIPTLDNQGKIDRWIGCVQGMVQALDLFNFDELREMTRQDLQQTSK